MKNGSVAWGVAGGAGLLVVYFGVFSIANSPAHAVQQFRDMWYWVLALALVFGTQVGLYVYLRRAHRLKMAGLATTSVSASGSVSTASMIACCAHHLSDVLPLLSLSAAAVFLDKYQLLFILAGVFSNVAGISFMLNLIKKNELADEGLLKSIVKYDWGFLFRANLLVSVLVILAAISLKFIG